MYVVLSALTEYIVPEIIRLDGAGPIYQISENF
jgi:hypothetical protein